MASTTAPRGLIVDLVTPLARDGSIDGRGLARQLERVAPHADAVYLASPYLGEGYRLNPDRRAELLDKALVVLREKTPIFIWVTQKTGEDTRATLHALKKKHDRRNTQTRVFWVDSPLQYHSNRGLPELYRELSRTFHQPFILHNDPALISPQGKPFKRTNIRTAVLKELSGLESIVGLIHVGSLDRAHHYQKACRARSQFRIYDGDESHFLEHPSMSGGVSLGANLAPRAWEKITRSSLKLSGGQSTYPSYLEQVWEMGGYVRSLKALYETAPVKLVSAVLSDLGILGRQAAVPLEERLQEARGKLEDLMVRYGDFPRSPGSSAP